MSSNEPTDLKEQKSELELEQARAERIRLELELEKTKLESASRLPQNSPDDMPIDETVTHDPESGWCLEKKKE